MRKRITHNLYFLFLLINSFTCVYVVFQEASYKEIISFITEIDSEVTEDEGLTDSNEVHFNSIASGLINSQERFSFVFLSNSLSNISYFFNIQEIYLGLTTPPPKFSFS